MNCFLVKFNTELGKYPKETAFKKHWSFLDGTSNSQKCIWMGHALPYHDRILFLNMDITLDPYSKNDWTYRSLGPLIQVLYLVEGVSLLPETVSVMDGMCKGFKQGTKSVCPVVVANFGQLPIKLPAFSSLAKLTRSDDLQMFLLKDCLTVTNEQPRHERIDLLGKETRTPRELELN